MKKISLLYTGFFLVALLAGIHFVAEALYLYWTVWWFDSFVHLLAGLSGCCGGFWFLFDSGIFYKQSPNVREAIFTALVCMIIAGTLWEVFEYTNDIMQPEVGYISDTILDLIMDATGAVLAGLIGARKIFHADQ